MLFMIVSRTRQNLSSDEFVKLGGLAKNFYASIPQGITLHSDWAALDGSRTFALLEAEDEGAIEKLQAPFRPYVDMDIVAVRRLSGWEIS